MIRRVAIAVLLALSTPALSSGARIANLVPVIREDAILVSFRVEDAFNSEMERAIETGLPVTFRYNVELKRVRGVWFDRRVSRRRILTTVVYDNLTQRYSLTREIDGEIDATYVVDDDVAMREFMTNFESVHLFDVSDVRANEEYYLRVNGVMKDRNLLLFIPWDIGADWEEAHFTYLP
jgi:hypothetical protein